MFVLLKLLFSLAMSKRGRRALRSLAVFLNSDDGRRLLAQARRFATGPQAQRGREQLLLLLQQATKRAAAARARREPQRWFARPLLPLSRSAKTAAWPRLRERVAARSRSRR